jgi:hypothetical protein
LAETPIEDRRFTDREVHEILKKAVERSPSRALAKREGLSLAELRVIGEEVGIDPHRLEDAARSVVRKGDARPNPFLGAPTVLNCERRVEGEFDRDATPEILSLIRRTMGQQGEVNEIRGSLEWSTQGEAGDRHVTLSARDGNTTIHGMANLTNAAILTYLPAGILGLITSFAGVAKSAQNGSQLAVILFLLVLPVLYSVLRVIFGTVSRSESAKLERVVEELARLTEGSAD